MLRRAGALLLAALACASQASAQDKPTCSVAPVAVQRSSKLLNVHLVPHSHDDVGWCVQTGCRPAALSEF